MTWKIPLFKTYWEENDVKAVDEVIRRGSFWATGPEIVEFEKRLASFTGRKYALTFNSGTSALHTMLSAYDVNGKEVIVPTFTFIATANAVVLAGGVPVFAESEDVTFGLDAEDVKSRINKNTAAILTLNYAGGVSRDIEKLRKIADDNGILLLEDNAHSLGVKKNGKMCGTFGQAAALSFCQNKLITTGEGGAVITDDQEIFEKMKLIRSHGRVEEAVDYFSSTKDHEYVDVGYNYRMPTMCAALGLSQLNNFDKIIGLRIKAGLRLNNGLKEFVKVPEPYENSAHFFQMYTIMLKDNDMRDKLQAFLTEKGIMSKVYYEPIHLKKFYKDKFGCKEGDLPKTEAMSKRILTLPIWPGISDDDVEYIINAIRVVFNDGKDN
ncbi:MAG: DegT/DnrJ/EryC1/StrS family aminotransferase [Nanoarchaeota archaeon]|nr:DegT/DnrJ/EryC1/StrS family aminotransferase [Nanoarchaeota archaeon]